MSDAQILGRVILMFTALLAAVFFLAYALKEIVEKGNYKPLFAGFAVLVLIGLLLILLG